MAREIVVKFIADTKDFNKAIDDSKRKLESAASGGAKEFNNMRSAISASTIALTAFGLAGVAALRSIGTAALDAAIKIDRQVSSLKALTGSAEAATKRFQELFKIAQATPGLTTSLATTLDTQLRVFNVAEATINKLLPVVGRLNAISPLGDPKQFVNNLTQLISQNFEGQDLKELIGQSPIAGKLLAQIFNVDNPTNAEAIRAAAKRMGITTVEKLAEELVKAAENNSALKNAVETIGGQFDKLKDRLDVALAPLGAEIAKTLIPIFNDLVKIVETYGSTVADVFRDNRNEIVATAREITAMAVEVGKLVGEIIRVGSQSGVFKLLARSAGAIQDIINNPFSLEAVGPAERAAIARFDALDAEAATVRNSPFLSTPEQSRAAAAAGGGGRTGGALTGGRTGGGGGVASSAARDAARKQAQEIAEMRKKILDAQNQFFDDRIKELEDVERAITGQNLENIRQGAEAEKLRANRPAQLALSAAARDERIRGIEAESAQLARNTARKAAEDLAKVPVILSNSERLMRGFANATETAGDAFERFGANVAFAFTNVRTLFDSLKRAVLGFFNDLLGSALQNIVRGTLGGIFGSIGGSLGNLFRSPVSTPASISSGAAGALSPFIGFGQGLSPVESGGTIALSTQAAFRPSFLGGIGKSLAGAAPFLGLSLGGGLGGQSIAGGILGSAGGFLAGGAVAGAAGLLGPAATAFFTNPFTAIAGVGLLVGGALLGKAKQRKQDEQASGEFLSQALNGIEQILAQVSAGGIDGSQARALFENQVLFQFVQQIKTLKTQSVVQSRLTNQTQDLRNVFESRLPGAVTQAQERLASQQRIAAIDRRLVPEFASGGTTAGGLALLHPGEKVLNLQQQSAIRAMAGPSVFERAGVPGIKQKAIFDTGGTMGRGFAAPIEINLQAQVLIGKSDATRIVVVGATTPQGQAVLVNGVKAARTDREL